jgi:type II secretory ATPase GspE/PulE/Tfp pilus assembly ATPase PilB-like protein
VGRIPIFEVITLTDEIRNAIKQAKSLSEIGTEFRRAKMLYMQEQALKKVIAGTTAINEMVRVLSATREEDTKKSEENA